MKRLAAGCLALAMWIGASPASAQPREDRTIDALYELGQREMAMNWRALGKTHESAVFMHHDVKRTGDGALAVWLHHELPVAGYIDKEKAYLSTRERVVVDCRNARIGTTDVAYYADRFGFGEVVGSTRSKAEPADVVPDSIEEMLIKVACAPKPKPARRKAAPAAKD